VDVNKRGVGGRDSGNRNGNALLGLGGCFWGGGLGGGEIGKKRGHSAVMSKNKERTKRWATVGDKRLLSTEK